MTHDELLAKLSSTNRRYGGSQDNSALRAVVELHKPVMAFGDHVIICAECEKGAGNGEDYPCPTIQTIEKEME